MAYGKRPDRTAAARTTKTLLRRPLRRRAEGSSPLLRLTANPAKDVIPRNANRANTVEFIKATVKFLALGWRNRHGFGCPREAVPNLLQQLKPLLGAKARDIDGVHYKSIPPRLA
jgi:hypothetical protein